MVKDKSGTVSNILIRDLSVNDQNVIKETQTLTGEITASKAVMTALRYYIGQARQIETMSGEITQLRKRNAVLSKCCTEIKCALNDINNILKEQQ